ncbi:FAD-dependent monooxygenase [Streptomyces sp. NPDC089919]|uniref:FAD-dependent monooxygenase n=1 Tax=Streptomyces sp. NPDC089919 TaxID=3155188 RepID=UPI0034318D3B
MSQTDTDVIIVGAGPVGLMLACELRLAGVECLVLEKSTEPTDQSRALGFTSRTIETFDQRGLLPRFGGFDTIQYGHFGGVPMDFTEVPDSSYGAKGVPQSLTVAVLNAWADELGAPVRRGWEVTDLEDGEERVAVEVTGPEGPARLTAKYLVGCDGARSTIRKRTGIGFPGHDAAIELDFAEVVGVQVRPRPNGERSEDGLVLAFQQGPDIFRVTYYDRHLVPRKADETPSFEEVSDTWKRLTGEDISHGTPRWIGKFTDATRQAAEYRRGRVFLAGDAAHIHLPIGGQGMSAGVQDAVNLGWKLAAAIHGTAPADLLDTYHSERHPVGERVITNTLTQRMLYISGSEMQPMRDLFGELAQFPAVRKHLIDMITGLDIRYETGPGEHPLLGRRLPDAELTEVAGRDGAAGEDGTSSTFALLHPARPFVLDLTGDAQVRAAAARWAGRVDTVSARPAGGAEGLFGGVSALLVRPDGYLAWVGTTGTGAEGLTEALTRWFGVPVAD